MDARISGGRRAMGEKVFLWVRRLHNTEVNAAISSSRRACAPGVTLDVGVDETRLSPSTGGKVEIIGGVSMKSDGNTRNYIYCLVRVTGGLHWATYSVSDGLIQSVE